MYAGINIEVWLCRVHADQCRSRALLPASLFSLHRRVEHWEAALTDGAGMGSLTALRTVLVLGLVGRLAGCAPGLNGTADRWEALYSRSLARIQGEKREESGRDSDYLLGIKRLRRLYCNVGIGFHIQVLPDGRITGVHNEHRYSKFDTLFPHCSVFERAKTTPQKFLDRKQSPQLTYD